MNICEDGLKQSVTKKAKINGKIKIKKKALEKRKMQ